MAYEQARNEAIDLEVPLLRNGEQDEAPKKSTRFEAVDLFRGLIMVVMAWYVAC